MASVSDVKGCFVMAANRKREQIEDALR